MKNERGTGTQWAALHSDDKFVITLTCAFAAVVLLLIPTLLIGMAGGNLVLIGAFCLAAILLFVAEVFIPSFGVLTLAGIVLLSVGIYESYSCNPWAAYLVILHVGGAFVGAMIWAFRAYQTSKIGQMISPPNPKITDADRVPVAACLVGQIGKAITPLHPVGRCNFDGKLVDCISDLEFLPTGTTVRITRTTGSHPVVEAVPEQP